MGCSRCKSIRCQTRGPTSTRHSLDYLNAAEFTYSGTNLRLVYSIAGQAEIPEFAPD